MKTFKKRVEKIKHWFLLNIRFRGNMDAYEDYSIGLYYKTLEGKLNIAESMTQVISVKRNYQSIGRAILELEPLPLGGASFYNPEQAYPFVSFKEDQALRNKWDKFKMTSIKVI